MRWLCVLLLLSVAWAQGDDDDDSTDEAPKAKLKVAKTADKVDARDALPETVTVTFTTTPSVAANVYHGKRMLCTTPCSISRKRDSGPMDVVFRASGYLPLHTRAFTFKDDKVRARMVAYGNESKLLGYKQPLDAGAEEPEFAPGTVQPDDAPAAPDPAPTPAPAPAAAPTPTPVAPVAPAAP